MVNLDWKIFMASLEKKNLCIRESSRKRIWESAFVSEFIGVRGVLDQLLVGHIRLMLVLRCHMIMMSNLQ